MKTGGMEPQVLIDILVGAKSGVVYSFGTEHRGDLVVSYALKEVDSIKHGWCRCTIGRC